VVKLLKVRPRPGHPCQGLLVAGSRVMRCALGRSGIGSIKREGDGKTPRGQFDLLAVHMRAGRMASQHASLPLKFIKSDEGWCDEIGDRNYNQQVRLPYRASHEVLMRKDHLYDVFIVLDYNIRRRMSRGGSAIFFHLAHPSYSPTEGCVAISRADMNWLLPRLRRDTKMVVV